MTLAERRERRRKKGVRGMIANARGLIAKVDAIVDAIMDDLSPEEIDAFVDGLEEAFPQAAHSLSLLYALTEDVKPENVKKIKAKISVPDILAFIETLAGINNRVGPLVELLDGDGKGDLELPTWLLKYWPLIRKYILQR